MPGTRPGMTPCGIPDPCTLPQPIPPRSPHTGSPRRSPRGGWGTNARMGTPWNPWDPKVPRTPGGSSSGSGVAVAARLAPWAIGTDTGGSVRLPASFCGLTGLKTTIGRVSTYGILPLSPTLDTPGALARSVEDAALLYRAMQGPDPLDPHTLGVPPGDLTEEWKRGIRPLRRAAHADDADDCLAARCRRPVEDAGAFHAVRQFARPVRARGAQRHCERPADLAADHRQRL